VERLDDATGFVGYELNVSCPNVKQGGMEFGADPEALQSVIRGARAATKRPLFVKLSPTLPNIGDVAKRAVDAGADGITVINTIPGLVVDVERRTPMLGFGSGGVSGPGLLAVGVLATWRVRKAVSVPILGAGGIQQASDVLQFVIAGASAVAIGTAGMADPKLPTRIVRDLERWCARHGVSRLADLTGTLEWPS
jgi:dihydroorotate dehydrogenase (NAD+) catalytic subunit